MRETGNCEWEWEASEDGKWDEKRENDWDWVEVGEKGVMMGDCWLLVAL
jgi:hypothetical protein